MDLHFVKASLFRILCRLAVLINHDWDLTQLQRSRRLKKDTGSLAT